MLSEANGANKALVELEHIDLTFNPGTVNETCLFEDFNFRVDRGEFVSVVGSNGSGKTSMLNLICGTLSPEKGRILLDGEDITKVPEFRRSKRIGRVFQNPAKGTCPDLTILENLSLADNKGKPFGLARGVNPVKRARLVRAGADVIAGDFTELEALLGFLGWK